MPKTVLFAWELGGGLGHLMQMLPLARGLVRGGHRVAVALRHLSASAAELFGRVGVTFLQAPFRSKGPLVFPRPENFAHLLANVGFANGSELFALTSAWRNLFRMVKPDLVVFDHSPTALLASRGIPGMRRALIGSGFCCPPDECPFPAFRPEGGAPQRTAQELAEDEERLLSHVNKILSKWGEAPLDRLGRLYSDVDENFLTTFPELDHYPRRGGARYSGPVIPEPNLDANGALAVRCPPRWPDGNGRRVFAYLKASRSLPRVLHDLQERGCPTLLYVEGVDPAKLRKRFGRPSLRFEDRPLDLGLVAPECDLAVLNGGHGVTAEMLLAGKPILEVPLVLEQTLTAEAVRRIGAGEAATIKQGSPWEGDKLLEALLTEPRYGRAARSFAERHAAFDPCCQRQALLERAHDMLGAENLHSSHDVEPPLVPAAAASAPHSGHVATPRTS
jgi:hypothetical protein